MHPLAALAMSAVKAHLKRKEVISPPDDLPEEFLKERAGTFVTITGGTPGIEKKKRLRGCIGTYLPTKENIAKEVISNAIAAATEDFRFGPVKEEELPELSFTVYILDEPKPIEDTKELDPKKFGIIVRTAPITSTDEGLGVIFDGHRPFKTGILLPGIEGINKVEDQILMACQKAGINLKEEKIVIYKFAAKKYE